MIMSDLPSCTVSHPRNHNLVAHAMRTLDFNGIFILRLSFIQGLSQDCVLGIVIRLQAE